MEISNGRIGMDLDDRTGSILRIVDRTTGLVHLDAQGAGRGDGRLFRVMIPHPEMFSRRAESHEQRPARVERQGAALSLRFTDLQAHGQSTGVDAEVLIDASSGADEIRFTLKLTNNGSDDVLDVWFPLIGGWTGLGGPGKDMMILGARGECDPHSLPQNLGYNYARIPQRMSFTYPVAMYAPWADLSGPGGGISYVNYMTGPQNGHVSIENLAGHGPGLRLAWGWVFPALIKSGQTWTSAPVGISLHPGDWHVTADRYRHWMNQWFKAPPANPRRREMIGYQNVFLRGFDGEPFHALDAVPAIAAAGRKYGVDHLTVWDFITLGNYAKRVDLDVLDYTPREKTILREALLRAKAEGTNVSALINFRLTRSNTTLFRVESHQELIRCYDGTARSEQNAATHFHPHAWARNMGPYCNASSPFAPTFRARVLRYAQEYADLGYTSMFFDQPFEELPDYAHLHRGCAPEDTYGAVVSLLDQVRQILLRHDADAYMIGEYCEAFAAQHIDLWMSWYPATPPAIRAAYALPQTMHSWVIDANPAQASHAFAVGMYFCLCTHGNEGTLADEPAFGEHVAALARLRRRCAARTVHSRFNDTLGLQIESDGPGLAYSFDGSEGPAVTIAALDGPAKIKVNVNRQSFAQPGRAGEGRLCRLDGSCAPTRGDELVLELRPHEAAVWEL